jgi:hypothetical protein
MSDFFSISPSLCINFALNKFTSVKVNKFRYILLGLTIGLIIGLGISTISDSLIKFDYLIRLKDLLSFNSKVDDSKEKKDITTGKKDSVMNKIVYPYNMGRDTLQSASNNDTVLSRYDTKNSNTTEPDNDDVVVYRDKMISSKYLKVKGLAEVSNNKIGLLDSLLMNDSQKHPEDMLLVEFWQSPVNYKGYKLSENKLIVFGIDDYNSASIEIISKEIVLFYQNKYYQLEYSNDYKPLIISDKPDGSGEKKNEKTPM